MMRPPLTAAVRPPGWDALCWRSVLALLRIVGLAEAGVLPRIADVLRHPLLGNLLPAAGQSAMGDIGPRPGDHRPDALRTDAGPAPRLLATWASLAAGALRQVAAAGGHHPHRPCAALRQAHPAAPANIYTSYTHDGGVIKPRRPSSTSGRQNPYREDYTGTPMAGGFSRYRTAALPTPTCPGRFYSARRSTWQGRRWAPMTSVESTCPHAHHLGAGARQSGQRAELGLVAVGPQPDHGPDVIFSQNDSSSSVGSSSAW